MKPLRLVISTLIIAALVTAAVIFPAPERIKWLALLFAGCFIALLRVVAGPTAADRAASLRVFGILIIGFCGILCAFTGSDLYIDIAIAWAIQAFIGIIAISKYIEGRPFDD